MQIIWKGAAKTNFRAGRQIYKPKAIVIHRMQGTLPGTDAWFNNPVSLVSSHYGIGLTGTIHQYVRETDTAFHAGTIHNPTWPSLIKGINPNLYTLGIEHEGFPDIKWSPAMYAQSLQLVHGLCRTWSIPIDMQHIIGHHEIYDGHNCPGPTWNKLAYLNDLAKSNG